MIVGGAQFAKRLRAISALLDGAERVKLRGQQFQFIKAVSAVSTRLVGLFVFLVALVKDVEVVVSKLRWSERFQQFAIQHNRD